MRVLDIHVKIRILLNIKPILNHNTFSSKKKAGDKIDISFSDPYYFDMDLDPRIHIWKKWIRILLSKNKNDSLAHVTAKNNGILLKKE